MGVSSRVVLLTGNTSDFEGTEGKLHQQLTEDMSDRGLAEDKIILVSSLSEFMDDHVAPVLHRIEELRSDIEHLLGTPTNKDLISLAIQDAYSGVEWNRDDLGLSWEYETIYLDMVENISEITLVDARRLPDDKYLTSFEADLDCTFDIFIYKPDFILIEDDPRLAIIDPDWNDHYFQAEMSLELHSKISLVHYTTDAEQSQFEIIAVEAVIAED